MESRISEQNLEKWIKQWVELRKMDKTMSRTQENGGSM